MNKILTCGSLTRAFFGGDAVSEPPSVPTLLRERFFVWTGLGVMFSLFSSTSSRLRYVSTSY